MIIILINYYDEEEEKGVKEGTHTYMDWTRARESFAGPINS